MEVQQLRYFLAVSENRSVSGAASALNVTQSTISQAVQALERELGAALFYRAGPGMALTSAGHALLGPARRIVREAAEARELFLSDAEIRGRLDVAALATAINGPLSELLSAFLAEFSAVTVNVRDLAREELAVEVLADGHSEIVCTRLPFEPGAKRDDLATLDIGGYDVVMAFPPGTPAPEGPVDLSAAPEVPMVLVPATTGTYPELEEALGLGQLRLAPVAMVEQRETRTAFMLVGVGATFLGGGAARNAGRAGAQLRPLTRPFRQRVGLVYDPARLSPVARAFIELAGSDRWRAQPAPEPPETAHRPGAPDPPRA